MKIAVASGKGGTGKTTISTNLAYILARSGVKIHLLDCDVEEPNSHIFIRPDFTEQHAVTVQVPEVNADKCTRCGICQEVCAFNAIACLPAEVLIFAELCHSCSGCERFCPANAIREVERTVGWIEMGTAIGFTFTHGLLNVGEVMATPVIKAVKKQIAENQTNIIDAPPGTSCPVIETVYDADYVIMVTEPTPFGYHDLTLAVEMVRALERPFGVVINRCNSGDERVVEYCRQEDIQVLMQIPEDRRIAEVYSRGQLVTEKLKEYVPLFEEMGRVVSSCCGYIL